MLKSGIRKQLIELFQFWIKVSISDKVGLQIKNKINKYQNNMVDINGQKNTNNSWGRGVGSEYTWENNHVHYQVNKYNLKDSTIFYLKISNNSHF